MNPPAAAEKILAFTQVSGLDMAGTLRVCAEILIRLERETTCDMMEVLTLLRRLVVEAEK
jgi:hypothetical protein